MQTYHCVFTRGRKDFLTCTAEYAFGEPLYVIRYKRKSAKTFKASAWNYGQERKTYSYEIFCKNYDTA